MFAMFIVQFRNESELKREWKGGYINGHISLDPVMASFHAVQMEIKLVTARGGIHPNTLLVKVSQNLYETL